MCACGCMCIMCVGVSILYVLLSALVFNNGKPEHFTQLPGGAQTLTEDGMDNRGGREQRPDKEPKTRR